MIEKTCLECNLNNGWISHVRYVLPGPGFILLLWFGLGLTTALEGSAFMLLLMESTVDNILKKHSKGPLMH